MATDKASPSAEADYQRALDLYRQRNMADAETLLRAIIARMPAFRAAWLMLGAIEHETGRDNDALGSVEHAIAIAPGDGSAHFNHGQILQGLNRLDDAVASYDRALRIDPKDVAALNNRAAALLKLKRPQEALENCGRAIAVDPDNARALNNRGAALLDLKRPAEALADYRRALRMEPGNADLINNYGGALLDLKRHDEALAAFDSALALKPDFVAAWSNRAEACVALKKYQDTIFAYDKVLALDPAASYAEGDRIHAKMHLCDWAHREAELKALDAHIDAGRAVARPFMAMASGVSAARQLRSATLFAADKYPPHPRALWHGEIYRHGKIRLGYVSGEFCEQATSHLAAGLFESHDRSRFAVHAFATGINDRSPMRRRLEAAFDAFADVSGQSDAEIAQQIRGCEIDILIDLNGYFGVERTGVFSYRPAPVQMNYLGFPGTMGASYMDYLVADAWVIPASEHDAYAEKIVRLPGSYQPNDGKRRISARTSTRSECGLPETGFVFACFNNSYKITPTMFDIWMRLLARVEGSVLWLLGDNPTAIANLRREAAARGIDSGRLVFAPRMKPDEHLARHALAGLFLDTLPCNAHTTASDALWAGLPLVTCSGETFAGRVAGSLLRAAGLPELIANSLEDYETLAFRLAQEPLLLAALREKLARNRNTCPLFDTVRYTRHLEAAFEAIWERHRQGLPPADIAIAQSL